MLRRLWSPWSQSWGWKGVYDGKDLWKRYGSWDGSERAREKKESNQIMFGRGYSSDPAGGAHDAPQTYTIPVRGQCKETWNSEGGYWIPKILNLVKFAVSSAGRQYTLIKVKFGMVEDICEAKKRKFDKT